MTKTAHTPGPWAAIPCIPGTNADHVAHTINDSQGHPVAGVSGCALHRPLGVPAANAKLIAAAPDLLAALQRLLEWADAAARRLRSYEPGPRAESKDPLFHESKPVREGARAAIAKATD